MAFIVFEGLDGCGKSTLLRSLCDVLESKKIDYITTREPGGTPLAEEIRNLLLRKTDESPCPRAEALLYQAARAQHVAKVIKPNLDKGIWVLCDRFRASSVAFQGKARQLGEASIESLNDFSTEGLKPDLTVLIALDVKESLRRIENRIQQKGELKDRMESENDNFHQAVADSFLKQSKENPGSWLVLQGEKKPEELGLCLLKEVEKRFWT